MSGSGSPTLKVDGTGLRVAIAAASWHEEFMNGLLQGAKLALRESGAGEPSVVVQVPGSFELPVVAARLARENDAVVALGVIIRGGTPHFEYVSHGVTLGLTEVAVRTGTPVGFGVLTCDNDAQAADRVGFRGAHESKGYEAAIAAMSTAVALRDLG